MNYIAEQRIINELKKAMGPNFEPTHELEMMLLKAYEQGRTDALGSLGIKESDLPAGDEQIAWTA